MGYAAELDRLQGRPPVGITHAFPGYRGEDYPVIDIWTVWNWDRGYRVSGVWVDPRDVVFQQLLPLIEILVVIVLAILVSQATVRRSWWTSVTGGVLAWSFYRAPSLYTSPMYKLQETHPKLAVSLPAVIAFAMCVLLGFALLVFQTGAQRTLGGTEPG